MMWLERAKTDGLCYKCGKEYQDNDIIGVLGFESKGEIERCVNHPDCWLALGLNMFEKDSTIGVLPITKQQRAERKALLHHWAQLSYRERSVRLGKVGMHKEDILHRLEKARDRLRLRMTMLGGMPESWRKK